MMTKGTLLMAVPGGANNPHYDAVMGVLQNPEAMKSLCGTMQPAGASAPPPASSPSL